MIYRIAQRVYKDIRKHGGLTVDEVAGALNRKPQTVYRAERGFQLLTPQQEEILHEKASVSTETFGDMLCAAATEVVGRQVRMSGRRDYLPTMPLARAAELYGSYYESVSEPVRRKIEAKLRQGRMLDAVADAMSSHFETEIRELIESDVGPDATAGLDTD